jgi:hypothetical protein
MKRPVVRPGRMGMAVRRWEDIKRAKLTPEQARRSREWAEGEIVQMNLRTLREQLGKTQGEIAEAAEMTQSELSRAERREDHLLSTLRRVVEALGGELEVVAHVGDKRIKLVGV